MLRINCLFLVLVFWCTTSSAEDGHCIWYGECGPNAGGKITNCYYNGTAVLLTDQEALQSLKSVCSMFYTGDMNTSTCCAPDQLHTLIDQLSMARTLLGRCPSCYYNFRSLFCSLTCHPQQSRFLTVKEFGQSSKYPGRSTVEAITNELAGDFPQRIIDSCRDVIFGDDHALSTLCGVSADQCTSEQFVRYLGLENPSLPFPIYFVLTNDTSEENYYNQSTFECNQPVQTHYENQSMCGRRDCRSSPPSPLPPDEPGKYSNLSLRTTHLIIVPDNQTFIPHEYFTPSPVPEILAGPALEMSFLQRVLDLQTKILSIEGLVSATNRSVRLSDVCLKARESTGNSCVVFSVFQYFQNSLENLNKTLFDEEGFFLVADYLTQIWQCATGSPDANATLLNISCYANFGGLIDSAAVFAGYPNSYADVGSDFLQARALVLTIILEDSTDAERSASVEAWEKGLWSYIQNFTDTQAWLRTVNRWDEMANLSIYSTNEHTIKRELNYMVWSSDE